MEKRSKFISLKKQAVWALIPFIGILCVFLSGGNNFYKATKSKFAMNKYMLIGMITTCVPFGFLYHVIYKYFIYNEKNGVFTIIMSNSIFYVVSICILITFINIEKMILKKLLSEEEYSKVC